MQPTRLAHLKKRQDFLRINQTVYKHHAGGLVLLAAPQPDENTTEVARVGYTASRKVGGAVQRNRAKRRLRAAVALKLAPRVQSGWDFVLIARANTVDRNWQELLTDIETGLNRIEKLRKTNNP